MSAQCERGAGLHPKGRGGSEAVLPFLGGESAATKYLVAAEINSKASAAVLSGLKVPEGSLWFLHPCLMPVALLGYLNHNVLPYSPVSASINGRGLVCVFFPSKFSPPLFFIFCLWVLF